MKIFYIEDHPQQREIIKQALEFNGYEVQVARDAETGLTEVATWRPDIILMDLRLPKMKGFEAVERLREDPHQAIANIPIIVVSAWHIHRKKAIEAGANSFLAKPFEIDKLIAEIEKFAG